MANGRKRLAPPPKFYLAGTLEPLDDVAELAAFRRLRATEDPALREELVRRNMRFVIFVCSHTKPYDAHWEEKVSGGLHGLLIAVDRFDPERGNQFSSFAVNWIRQKAQEQAYGEVSRDVMGPKTYVAQRWAFWHTCRSKLENLRLRAVTDRELIDWIEAEDIRFVGQQQWWGPILESSRALPWDPSVPEEKDHRTHQLRGSCYQSLEGLHTAPEVEDRLEQDDTRALALALLETLPDNLRQVVQAQYGLETGYPLTLEEVAQERVAQGGTLVTKQAISEMSLRGLRQLRQVVGVGESA